MFYCSKVMLLANFAGQIRAIKEELGDNDEDEDDVVALERKMQTVGMPPNVWKHAQRELRYTSSALMTTFSLTMQFPCCF